MKFQRLSRPKWTIITTPGTDMAQLDEASNSIKLYQSREKFTRVEPQETKNSKNKASPNELQKVAQHPNPLATKFAKTMRERRGLIVKRKHYFYRFSRVFSCEWQNLLGRYETNQGIFRTRVSKISLGVPPGCTTLKESWDKSILVRLVEHLIAICPFKY